MKRIEEFKNYVIENSIPVRLEKNDEFPNLEEAHDKMKNVRIKDEDAIGGEAVYIQVGDNANVHELAVITAFNKDQKMCTYQLVMSDTTTGLLPYGGEANKTHYLLKKEDIKQIIETIKSQAMKPNDDK